MPVSLHRIALAAALLAPVTHSALAQGQARARALHDSITVTTLTFPGAEHVSPDDLRRLLFTRGSNCRLPFLIPLCKVSPSQLFTDRRRTTSAALGDDILKLRVYFWRRGYREAQIDTVLMPEPRGMAVAFHVVEGPPTNLSALIVQQRAPVLSEYELASLVELKEGGPFDLVALDSTLAHLKATIWNKGYADVRIDTAAPPPDASHVVPLRITIDPRWLTRVGRVEFEGNRYLSDETLQRGILLQPGTLYTHDAVLESQKRLFASPAIARAMVVTPPAGDSLKIVTVAIAESPQRQASVTLGFNTVDYGQAAVEVRHNSLGQGRWLSLRGAVGNLLASQLDGRSFFQHALVRDAADTAGYLQPTWQAGFTLRQPWLFGARSGAELSAFAGRRALPNVVIDEDRGATLGLVHELAPRTPIGITYRLELTRVRASAVYFCAGYGVCDGATRDALMRTQRLAPVLVSAWVDRADDLESPMRGYTAVIDAEHASAATGSSFRHNRIAADAAYYYPLGERRVVDGAEQFPKVLAFHGRAGWVRPMADDRTALGVPGDGAGILHPRTLFYAGGMQSVRGFAENELGPTVLQARRESLIGAGCTDATIASGQCDPSNVPSNELFPRPIGGSTAVEGSVELRMPLARALGAVFFLDAARVGTAGLSSIGHARGAITPGGGFRYRSPLGVLRLDLGLRPMGEQQLPVVAAVADDHGGRIVTLQREKRYSPLDPSPGFFHSIGRRLVVHFATGQSF